MIQMAPVFLRRQATLEKVAERLGEVAAKGCHLAAFSEALVPGYPVWICRTDGARFDAKDQKELHALYLQEAVQVEAGHLQPIQEIAAETRMAVVLGIIERPADRGGHSVYCSTVFVDKDGCIGSVHRKLMPTYEERLSWAMGDGAGLVVHGVGEFTLGALNCWENWMPLARSALYGLGENLHVALWPGGDYNTADITRFIARESRSYVLSVSGLLRASDLPDDLPHRERILAGGEDVILNGGSAAAGPDGNWLLQPVVGTETCEILELNPERVFQERQNFDPFGHYARPDVLQLHVNRQRQTGLQDSS
jgi:nitrilase